ncbi:hypothetical protein B0H13DRAFT_835040 [Mycena leptocephala]|nr:hypothetical protein B0H13DRAFT_835040 [Mycena leptocephala]
MARRADRYPPTPKGARRRCIRTERQPSAHVDRKRANAHAHWHARRSGSLAMPHPLLVYPSYCCWLSASPSPLFSFCVHVQQQQHHHHRPTRVLIAPVYTYFGFSSLVSSLFLSLSHAYVPSLIPSHLISSILILIWCTIRYGERPPPSPFPTHWPSQFSFSSSIHPDTRTLRYTEKRTFLRAPPPPRSIYILQYDTIRGRDSLKTYLFRSALL